MAVTVSIPTILRTHTGGERSVEAKGGTVSEVIDDLEAKHGGIKARLITDGALHRFVNIYVDDEDVRFAGGLDAPVGEDSAVTILPAVAGGSATVSTVAGGSATVSTVAGGSATVSTVAGGSATVSTVAGG